MFLLANYVTQRKKIKIASIVSGGALLRGNWRFRIRWNYKRITEIVASNATTVSIRLNVLTNTDKRQQRIHLLLSTSSSLMTRICVRSIGHYDRSIFGCANGWKTAFRSWSHQNIRIFTFQLRNHYWLPPQQRCQRLANCCCFKVNQFPTLKTARGWKPMLETKIR